MSFDISDSVRIANDKKVLCNYYDCSIYLSQYERTPNNGGYIKIPYFTPENVIKPNTTFISGEPTINYMSNKLYIFKKTHNINGVKYDGELIIENKRITNGTNNMYICFPLITNTRNASANQLDKIIDNSEKLITEKIKITVNLNSMFNKLQKYIFYKSGDDIVVVFTEPIKVKNSFDGYIPCELFSAYNENYNILQNVSGNEGFQNFTEGFVEGEKNKGTPVQTEGSSGEMDCYPIDEKGNSVIPETTIVGLTTGSASQDKTINLLFTMIMFVIILSVSIVGGPPLYKYVFYTKFEDTKLQFTFLFVLFYLCWSFLGMTIGGFIIKDGATSLAGLFFTVLIGISGIISYLVLSKDTDFADYKPGDWDKIREAIMWMFSEYLLYWWTNGSKYIFGHVVAIISIIISSIFLGLVTNKKNKNKSKRNLAGQKDEAKRKNFAIAMISVFGLFYAIFIVGPFVGFITERKK
jgi:hypothetical protein